MKTATANILRKCGIRPDLKGWEYTGCAIEMVMNNWNLTHAITKELYPAVAKQFNTTRSRVERAIRHAVEVGFDLTPISTMQEIFGNTLDPHSGKVTNATFIATIADILMREGEEQCL